MTNLGGSPAPGWYYADGDAPGTHRYWDGGQWVGGPQPAYGGPVGVTAPHLLHAAKLRTDLAGYGQRVVAWFVDAAAWWVPLIASSLLADSAADDLLTTLLVLLALAVGIGNSLVLQGLTGQSVGKRLMGTKIIQLKNDQPIGLGLMILRLVIPWGFSIFSCYIYWILDFLWPLWDDGNERITDKILKTAVVRQNAMTTTPMYENPA